jgi:hypothetical protein
VDVAKVNQVESELDAYINRADKRRRETAGEREREELYEESCRRHHARREAELAWEWLRFHVRQLRNHQTTAALIARHHEQEIRKYEEMLNINHDQGDAA